MSAALRLNLGCGSRQMEGCVNVDRYAGCQPDALVDLEQFPWPWADNSVGEIHLIHSLEHLGETVSNYLKIFQEMWRVCQPGALVHIVVPHPRHDAFINDPTHVRAVTPDGLLMFCQQTNRRWAEMGAPNTPLGEMLGIDFRLLQVSYEVDAYWRDRLQAGEITEAELNHATRTANNVLSSIAMTLQAIKPAGSAA